MVLLSCLLSPSRASARRPLRSRQRRLPSQPPVRLPLLLQQTTPSDLLALRSSRPITPAISINFPANSPSLQAGLALPRFTLLSLLRRMSSSGFNVRSSPKSPIPPLPSRSTRQTPPVGPSLVPVGKAPLQAPSRPSRRSFIRDGTRGRRWDCVGSSLWRKKGGWRG
jgi:hypothetical protein